MTVDHALSPAVLVAIAAGFGPIGGAAVVSR
jgi:hypothetical protein